MLYPKRYPALILILILAIAASSCGIKGPPLAPLRKTFPAIADLTAVLSGSVVKLSWTPSLRYSDGSELQLRNVYIYRLDQDLTEALRQQAEDAAERLARGADKSTVTALRPPVGEVAYLAQRIRALPAVNFKRKASLVARLSVEQLIDRVESGKIRWSEALPLEPSEMPAGRAVYAVIEEDHRGRKSNPSNFAQVLPLPPLPQPTDLTQVLTQQSLTLNWNYPVRDTGNYRLFALIGFNIYKAAEGSAMPGVPVNTTPIPTAAPMEWLPQNLISNQQVMGSSSRFAYLMFSADAPNPAGVSQTLIPAAGIAEHKGATVRVALTLSAPGGKARGRIVLDASRDPLKPSEPAAGSQVFSERDNPLISITDIELSEEPKRFEAEFRLPSDSLALVLRIEPRGTEPISAPFILEAVSAVSDRGDVELVKNGDFSGFAPTVYTENIEKFDGKYEFKLNALYNVAGYQIESEATEPLLVELKDTFPPEAPRNPRALATSDSIAVSWNSSRDEDLRGYLVFRREGESGQWQRLTQQPQRGTIYRDSDIKPGVTYSYRIQAVDRAGNRSEYSTVVTAGAGGN